MNRWLFFIGLLLISTATLAGSTTFPALFTPAKEDLSIWYLGNIFGSDLMAGLVESDKISGIRLMSVLFGIFNQVALVVGIIIVVYTILAGTLNTANEGKPLGEKWNAMWMPVRTSLGIALLVPKGGSGYCLAQSLIMWLTVQGIGAGDQVWNAMVDYFAEGGAIYSEHTAQDTNYMTEPNIGYSLKVQGNHYAESLPAPGTPPESDFSLLRSMICVATYNKLLQESMAKTGESPTGNALYTAYTLSQDTTHVYFGDQAAGNAAAEQNYTGPETAGKECGAIVITVGECDQKAPGSKCGDRETREQIYTLSNWNMAQGLQNLAKQLAKDPEDQSTWENYYSTVFHNSELYINYLVGYEDVLFYRPKTSPAGAFTLYKKYGWILAGNYYSLLSALKEDSAVYNRLFHPPLTIGWEFYNKVSSKPVATAGDDYSKGYDAEDAFWLGLKTALYYEPMVDSPHYEDYISSYGEKTSSIVGSNRNYIGPVNMKEVLNKLGGMNEKSKTGKKKHRQKGASKGQATLATLNAVKNFLHYLTGEGGGASDMRVTHDPIMKAASYGKSLTSAAIPLMVTAVALHIGLAAGAWCSAQTPTGAIIDALSTTVVTSLLGIAVFMYTQGAILGVFVPLIPYVTFFIGVVGWMLQVVEAIAAAPLVAVGLIFPETQDEIWGRAKPAYMMILALFLRPPLMLVGFAAAMIVLWCLTELLNIGFLTLTAVTFRIEDMFGFITITTAYTAIFITVVTRSYELINVVPNKVLNWIGGPGMEVEGAREALGAAKGGVETGAGAVGGGAKSASESLGGTFEKDARESGGLREQKRNAMSAKKDDVTAPKGGADATSGKDAGKDE